MFSKTFIVKNISNSFDIHNCLFTRLHFSIGNHDYHRTSRFRQSFHFSITQVFFCVCEWALFTKPRTTLGLVAQAFWRVPLFTEWIGASSFEVSLQGHRDVLPLGLLPLGLRVLDGYRSFCRMKGFGDGFDGVTFPRLSTSWRKLQLFPFTHCPLVSQCQQSPRILCTRCFVLWFLTTAFLIIPTSEPENLISNFLLDISFHHSSQSVIIRFWFYLMNLQVIQFQYGLEFSDSRIHYLYNPSKMSSCGIFVIDNVPSHSESNSWMSSFRRQIVNKSAYFLTESWLPMTRKFSQIK